MSIIAIIGVIWLASVLNKAVKRQRAKQAALEKQMAIEREVQRKINERLEKEQERQQREQERQAAQLAKHEKRIADLKYRIEQAEEDIDNLAWRIEEQQKYSVFLQEQRDKCSFGSPEYFKWQNKLTVVDNKVYQLDKQMRKAVHARDMAKKEMGAA